MPQAINSYNCIFAENPYTYCMDFDERQLRGFVAVAETGSLGRAAREVNLTQPTLSRQIQGLEDQLGQRLFERESRGMALTAAGELLVPHARHLLFEMQNTRDELAALRGLRRGTVRVGAVAAVLRTLVAETVGRLNVGAPDIKVELLEAVDDELVDALLTRQVDLVVTSGAVSRPELHAIGICAYRDRFAVFCASDGPLAEGGGVDEVLAREWVMPPQGSTPRVAFEALVDSLSMPRPRIVVETTSVETMIAVTLNSNLLCWLPEPLMQAHLANGSVRRIDVPQLAIERQFLLYRRGSGLLPDAAREFVSHFPLQPKPERS